MKLKRIRINRFRNIAPGTELRFNHGINVLLGKNASGKTTLLKLLTMVGNGAFPGLEQEEFDLEGDLDSGRGVLRVVALNRRIEPAPMPDDIAGHGEFGLQPSFRFEYRIDYIPPETTDALYSINAHRAQATFRARGEEPLVVDLPDNASPFSDSGTLFFRIVLESIYQERWRRFTQKQLSRAQVWAFNSSEFRSKWLWTRFDEALFWQEMLLDAAFVTLNPQPSGYRYIPDDVFNQLFGDNAAPRTSEDLVFSSATTSSLEQAAKVLGFQEITLKLSLGEKRLVGDRYEAKYSGMQFYFTKHDGTRLPLERLSFGQQRLFSFFYYLSLYDDVVVADELANGMHHAMIADCLEAIGARQAFLATQNPLLLDHLIFSDADEVRRTFVLCETGLEEGLERIRWTQLSSEDADDFFRDYQVGFQHNNDILRTRGLW